MKRDTVIFVIVAVALSTFSIIGVVLLTIDLWKYVI